MSCPRYITGREPGEPRSGIHWIGYEHVTCDSNGQRRICPVQYFVAILASELSELESNFLQPCQQVVIRCLRSSSHQSEQRSSYGPLDLISSHQISASCEVTIGAINPFGSSHKHKQ